MYVTVYRHTIHNNIALCSVFRKIVPSIDIINELALDMGVNLVIIPTEWKTLVNWTSENPSKFFSPYAAYVIPKDLKKGECVLINDVITNHVSGRWNQGDVYRLSKSEAIWTGKYFYIDVSSYTIGEFIG